MAESSEIGQRSINRRLPAKAGRLLRKSATTCWGGTLNLDGDLLIEATAPGAAGTLKKMAESVAAAALAKAGYQRLADTVARWFLPGVVVVALATLIIHAQRTGLPGALLSALAVILIACPCALALATPMAIWAALGRASRGQVLFQHGDALCRLPQAKAICFDKTGTLTRGETAVERFLVDPEFSENLVLHVAATLAASSRHQHSLAVGEYANVRPGVDARDVQAEAGRGVSGYIERLQGRAFLGSRRWMDELGLTQSPQFAQVTDGEFAAASSLVCVGWDGQVRGLFVLREDLRAEAGDVVNWFKRAGYHVIILSGDTKGRAAVVGEELGVDVEAELLPADKLSVIRRLQGTRGPVIMVGDGINDAPALAAADVGIALGSGADVSRHSGDICLLGNDLARLPWAIGLARRSVAVIRWNLLWAFAYNTAGMALAATGLLNPMLAAAAMVVSSLLVVTNSLRLAGLEDEELCDLRQTSSPQSLRKSSPANRSSFQRHEIPATTTAGGA